MLSNTALKREHAVGELYCVSLRRRSAKAPHQLLHVELYLTMVGTAARICHIYADVELFNVGDGVTF